MSGIFSTGLNNSNYSRHLGFLSALTGKTFDNLATKYVYFKFTIASL